MGTEYAYQPGIWLAALIVLALAWPISQRFRHERLRPLAAYLLFTSVLTLVSGLLFMMFVWAGRIFLTSSVFEEPAAGVVITVLSILSGAAAGWFAVRFPQERRFPK